MKVIVATVGGSEEPIVIASRKLGLDKTVLIAGKPASEVFDEPVKDDVNPLEVSREIKNKLENLGAIVEMVPVNPFDFEECCIKALEAIEVERGNGNDVSVVITGGTKVQVLAASYAAFICGCRMYYVQQLKGDSRVVEIPLTFSGLDDLSRAKKDVIKHLRDGDTAESIAGRLGISRKTASQYLKELREYGLVECRNDGRVRKYSLTFSGKICRARW